MQIGSGALTSPLGGLLAYMRNGLEVLRFGGLDTGEKPTPFEIIERRPMYKLRRYFPDEPSGSAPPVLLVPPLMLAADVWDVSPSTCAVCALTRQASGRRWSTAVHYQEVGGRHRTLADHTLAVSDVVDVMRERTGRDVHLGGYSQGGMFCYQAAAYRRTKDVASVVTFGSPTDLAGLVPPVLPDELLGNATEFLAEHVFNRFTLPKWAARMGFQVLDPVKTARAQLDFLLQLHNRDALLARESQRRFLGGDGFVAWSGPALSELLRQFVVQNRMMTGGFAVGDRLVALSDITFPSWVVNGDAGGLRAPYVRAISRAAPNAEVFEFSVRAGHFGLVVGSSASKGTWPAVTEWVHWREGTRAKAGVRTSDTRSWRRHGGAAGVRVNSGSARSSPRDVRALERAGRRPCRRWAGQRMRSPGRASPRRSRGSPSANCSTSRHRR